MKKTIVRTKALKMLADTITPVSIYLKIRDIYPDSILLESSDYHATENSYSYICMKPLATIEAANGFITETYPDGSVISTSIPEPGIFRSRFSAFIESFQQTDLNEGIPVNGLFGYTSYDAVRYFEKIDLVAVQD